MVNESFKKSIDDIKEMQKILEECNKNINIEEGKDSKGCVNKGPDIPRPTGKPPSDSPKGDNENINKDKKNDNLDPGTIMFNNITDTIIKIFETPEVSTRINEIATKMNMDKNTVSSLIEVISICVANSSYESILFYDDLLKKELTKQFDNMVHHINLLKAESEAYKGVLEVYRKQINDIKNDLIVKDKI